MYQYVNIQRLTIVIAVSVFIVTLATSLFSQHLTLVHQHNLYKQTEAACKAYIFSDKYKQQCFGLQDKTHTEFMCKGLNCWLEIKD